LKQKKRYRRGYPVAILAGIEEDSAVIWKVYSNVAKPEVTINFNGIRKNPKDAYNFYESIVNSLRPTLREGVRSIILVSTPRNNYHQELINHIRQHHRWLTDGPNKAAFSKITGFAGSSHQIIELTRNPIFQKSIKETTNEETENLIEILEKCINTTDNTNLVLFSLQEVEKLILKRQKPCGPTPVYLMLTNSYLADNPQKNRLHRLLQIASNKKVKTRIINAESAAGKRLTQLGGLLCLAQLE